MTAGEPRSRSRRPMPDLRFMAAVILFGFAAFTMSAAFGIAAAAAGLSLARTLTVSLLVFTGGGQFAALAVAMAGGSMIAVIIAGVLPSSRFGLLGFTAARHLQLSGVKRLLAPLVLIDASVLLAAADPDRTTARRKYWVTGLVMVVSWMAGTIVGATASTLLPRDFVELFDAMLPALFLGLLVPFLPEPGGWTAAAGGALIVLVLLQLVSPGAALMLAAFGAVAGLVQRARRERRG